MRHTTPKTSRFSHKHALKSVFVLAGVALVLALLIGGTGVANDQAAQEAARQAQIQKQEDDRIEREKAAEAVKTKAAYDKCIADANAHYSQGLDGIPDDLYGSARVLAIQAVGDLVESFKRDCDRMYTKVNGE